LTFFDRIREIDPQGVASRGDAIDLIAEIAHALYGGKIPLGRND
jgi:hypothetical protein